MLSIGYGKAYPCFAEAYLKTIHGDDETIRVTGIDKSEHVNN